MLTDHWFPLPWSVQRLREASPKRAQGTQQVQPAAPSAGANARSPVHEPYEELLPPAKTSGELCTHSSLSRCSHNLLFLKSCTHCCPHHHTMQPPTTTACHRIQGVCKPLKLPVLCSPFTGSRQPTAPQVPTRHTGGSVLFPGFRATSPVDTTNGTRPSVVVLTEQSPLHFAISDRSPCAGSRCHAVSSTNPAGSAGRVPWLLLDWVSAGCCGNVWT